MFVCACVCTCARAFTMQGLAALDLQKRNGNHTLTHKSFTEGLLDGSFGDGLADGIVTGCEVKLLAWR